MRFVIGLAVPIAAAVAMTPAQAQRWSDPGFTAAANVTVHRGGHDPAFKGWTRGDRSRHRGRHDRDRHDGDVDGLWLGGWAYPEVNRSWEADSYNDWWHDRPSRSFPRWVANNSNCERAWWSGGGWRC